MIQDELWRRMVQGLGAVGDYRADVLAVLNGAVGDQLRSQGSAHATVMSFWHDGVQLDLQRPLSEQLPGAKPDVVLWVHGLMACDRFWAQVTKPSLPVRLADDQDVTSICVRYNTGAHISENGRELADLLAQLQKAWPIEFESLSIIAHSMGGLVSRSAIHYGIGANASWVANLTRLFMVGVPQRGAPLEQLAHVASFTLRQIPNPWTWAISWVMRQRSAGIRDLRHGYVIDEDWMTRDAEALSLGRRYPAELPADLKTYVIAGTLLAGEHGPIAKAVGDAMVTPLSAKDESILGQVGTAAVAASRVFEGVGHVRLAGDEGVYQQILEWWNGI